MAQEHAETRAVMDDSFWSYGVGPNRTALDALCRYACEQGGAAKPITVEESFAPATPETSRI